MSNHEAINSYWDSVLDGEENLITIKYEELVSDQKNNQKKLYDFLQIKSSYSEEREGFLSKTASTQQVKEKIHTKSVKKLEFEDKKMNFGVQFINKENIG